MHSPLRVHENKDTLPVSRSHYPPKLPKSFFACHSPISIPTLTVMAVAADFHRRFLIPE